MATRMRRDWDRPPTYFGLIVAGAVVLMIAMVASSLVTAP